MSIISPFLFNVEKNEHINRTKPYGKAHLQIKSIF